MTPRMAALNEMKSKYDKLVKKEAKSILKESFAEFFKANPHVIGFIWEQYCPHFADGDPCVFSVGEPRARVPGIPESMGDYADGYLSSYDSLSELAEGESEYQNADGTPYSAGN